MSYISTIKKIGIKEFIIAVWNEIQKKLFVKREFFLNKNPDKNSFSQYAEDLFIDRILGYKNTGFYVDIGANNPIILSNTKKFYDRGWHGINIEPDTNNFKLFQKDRPRDINLNLGVSKTAGILNFYVFEENTLSTFSKESAKKLIHEGRKLVEEKTVEVIPLSEVLTNQKVTTIDFMTIDTEGYDQQVLTSNNWSIFRPKLICVEDTEKGEFDIFFKKNNYKKIYHNGLNSFFIDLLSYEKN